MKAPWWFKPEVNLNVILTAVGFIAMSGYVWSQTQSQAAAHAAQIAKLEIEDARIRSEIREVREKADAKLELLTQNMSEVRSALKGISTNIDWIVRQSGKDARAPP